MYCRAHKTATLTPIQHTVGGGVVGPIAPTGLESGDYYCMQFTFMARKA